MNKFSIPDLVKTINDCEDVAVVQEPEVGKAGYENELLLFVKPEGFMDGNEEEQGRVLDLIFDKLEEFGAVIGGVIVVSGKRLDQSGLMNKHYGFINQLSRQASGLITGDLRRLMLEKLGTTNIEIPVWGGHEYMNLHPELDPQKLDNWWREGPSTKVRSGFYVRVMDSAEQNKGQMTTDFRHETGERKFIMVNGFHPSQLWHFTNPKHRILLLLLHSNSEWKKLKWEMVGDTFPERADQGSIRGTLFANPANFGMKEVSIGYNGVHLSAGPFEAMFEIMNLVGGAMENGKQKTQPVGGQAGDRRPSQWAGRQETEEQKNKRTKGQLTTDNPSTSSGQAKQLTNFGDQTLMTNKLRETGLNSKEIKEVLTNPKLKLDGKETDLFSLTEDMDTGEAIGKLMEIRKLRN